MLNLILVVFLGRCSVLYTFNVELLTDFGFGMGEREVMKIYYFRFKSLLLIFGYVRVYRSNSATLPISQNRGNFPQRVFRISR